MSSASLSTLKILEGSNVSWKLPENQAPRRHLGNSCWILMSRARLESRVHLMLASDLLLSKSNLGEQHTNRTLWDIKSLNWPFYEQNSIYSLGRFKFPFALLQSFLNHIFPPWSHALYFPWILTFFSDTFSLLPWCAFFFFFPTPSSFSISFRWLAAHRALGDLSDFSIPHKSGLLSFPDLWLFQTNPVPPRPTPPFLPIR